MQYYEIVISYSTENAIIVLDKLLHYYNFNNDIVACYIIVVNNNIICNNHYDLFFYLIANMWRLKQKENEGI